MTSPDPVSATTGPSCWLNVDAVVERIPLDDTSWVEVVRGLLVDPHTVHADLVGGLAWEQRSNFRYERWVPEPRLGAYQSGDQRHPALVAVQSWIGARHRVQFDGVALAHYRDGRDGVGWHRDREMTWLDDTLIGVLTLGATRPFLVAPLTPTSPTGARPRIARDHADDAPGAESTLDLQPAAGDLIVMGGRCQSDWLHAVPPVRTACGSRVSAQWRWTSRTGRRDSAPSYAAPRHFGRGADTTNRPARRPRPDLG